MVEAGAKIVIGGRAGRGRPQARPGDSARPYVHLDVTQEASWADAMDATIKAHGKLDVLVKCS